MEQDIKIHNLIPLVNNNIYDFQDIKNKKDKMHLKYSDLYLYKI